MRLLFAVTLPMKAIGKGRPRMTRGGHVYTPQETRIFENTVQFYLKKHYRAEPYLGALSIALNFQFIRARTNKKTHHVSRPDIDNCVKGILDAANKILYKDDAQIVALSVTKVYAPQDEISLAMWAVDQDEAGSPS